MHVKEFVLPYRYSIPDALLRHPYLAPKIQRLSKLRRYALGEMINGDVHFHALYAVKLPPSVSGDDSGGGSGSNGGSGGSGGSGSGGSSENKGGGSGGGSGENGRDGSSTSSGGGDGSSWDSSSSEGTRIEGTRLTSESKLCRWPQSISRFGSPSFNLASLMTSEAEVGGGGVGVGGVQ
jgi:hypothetical protein